MNLGKNIKALRKENNLSQENLSELLCISRQAISKWENGLSEPDTNTLIKLAEIFKVSLDELTGLSSLKNEDISTEHKKSSYYIPKLVIISYLLSFSSIIGFYCPPATDLPYPTELLLITGAISGILLVVKNIKLIDKNKLLKVLWSDITLILSVSLLGYMIPNYMGLVKLLIILIPLTVYMIYITRSYFLHETSYN